MSHTNKWYKTHTICTICLIPTRGIRHTLYKQDNAQLELWKSVRKGPFIKHAAPTILLCYSKGTTMLYSFHLIALHLST